MDRFKVFDVLHYEHLAQVSLVLPENRSLKDVFEQLERKGIKIKFLVCHRAAENIIYVTFCVERGSFKTTHNVLTELLSPDTAIDIFPDVGMVGIHGPHFDEQSGIIDVMHNCLSSRGLRILAISTTVSTALFTLPVSEVVRAVDLLKDAFEIPQGKI
jgi:aspartokinase